MATGDKETKVIRIPVNFDVQQNSFVSGNRGNPSSLSGAINALTYGEVLYNCYTISSKGDKKRTRILPRPVVKIDSGSYPGSLVQGVRHMRFWPSGNTHISFVINNSSQGQIYRGDGTSFLSTSILSALAVPTGKVTGTDFYDGVNNYYVLGWGSVRPYYINTSFTATQIADVDCPSGTGTSPYIVSMDGALFVAKNNSIHNNEIGDITNWPGYSRTKEQFPEPIVALARHKNSVVALSSNSMEFFFNAGYSGTSPLSRQETYATRIGLHTSDSVLPEFVSVRDDIYFIGKSSFTGVGIYKLSNFRVTKVSNSYIDQIMSIYLTDWGGGLGSMHISYMPWHGTDFVFVQLAPELYAPNLSIGANSPMTLVYNVEEDDWHIWATRNINTVGVKSYNVGEDNGEYKYVCNFPYDFFSGTVGEITGIHSNLGTTVRLSSSFSTVGDPQQLYDYSTSTDYPIDFMIRTPVLDMGSMKQKHLKKMFLINMESRNSGTRPDISTYVFTSLFKEDTGVYPTPLTMHPYDDAQLTNLSVGRKFIVELQWSGGFWNSLEGLEFHYNEGEQ